MSLYNCEQRDQNWNVPIESSSLTGFYSTTRLCTLGIEYYNSSYISLNVCCVPTLEYTKIFGLCAWAVKSFSSFYTTKIILFFPFAIYSSTNKTHSLEVYGEVNILYLYYMDRQGYSTTWKYNTEHWKGRKKMLLVECQVEREKDV